MKAAKHALKAFVLLGGLSIFAVDCTSSGDPQAQVFRITSRSDLIGGPRALGEVGVHAAERSIR